MDEFAVTFDPPIRAARKQHQIKPNWTRIYAASVAARLAPLDPVFRVAGRTFGYHPADASVVLGDLLGAAEIISGRIDATISLSGYTVLLVEFREDRVFFRDPAGSYPNGGAPVGGSFHADEIELTLRRAADAVWELIFPRGT